MIDTPRTFAEVSAFIGDFEARRLPRARWTHEGHLVAGLWYVWHLGPARALESLRTRIHDHNTSVGTPNTDSSGYHETITRLYVEGIGRLRDSAPEDSFEEALARLMASPMASSQWPLSLYTAEQLFSVQARREWVPPSTTAISADATRMPVSIVTFPQTRVAGIRHVGHPSKEHETARRLVAWKLEHGLLDQARYRSYGLHYTDPRSVPPEEHRVDFCLSYDGVIEPNAHGIVEMTIPSMRCAMARDIGSRLDNKAARYLHDEWLPSSGERPAPLPLVFHYVNVGPAVQEHEAITDVYLPLR